MYARHIQFEADFSSCSQTVSLFILRTRAGSHTPHIISSSFLFATHPDVCTQNKSIIIRSCFTVSQARTRPQREREREQRVCKQEPHKNKHTIHNRKESKNAISFCVTSHLVFVYMIVYIPSFRSLVLFFWIFSWISHTWQSGCSCACVCVCLYLYENAICYLASQTVTYISFRGNQCTVVGRYMHNMPRVISNPNVLVIWNERNYHFYISLAVATLWEKIIMNFVFMFQSIPVDNKNFPSQATIISYYRLFRCQKTNNYFPIAAFLRNRFRGQTCV